MRIPHLHPTLSEIWTYPAEDVRRAVRYEGARRRADRSRYQWNRPLHRPLERVAHSRRHRADETAQRAATPRTCARPAKRSPLAGSDVNPDLVVFPEARAHGIFSRRRGLRSRAAGAPLRSTIWRGRGARPAATRRWTSAADFTKTTAARTTIARSTCASRAGTPRSSTSTARCSCRPTASSTRSAFSRAGRSLRVFETRFGTRGDADLRGRLARDRSDDRGDQGRAHS